MKDLDLDQIMGITGVFYLPKVKQGSIMDFRQQCIVTLQTAPAFYRILVLLMQTQTRRELRFLVFDEFVNCTD